MSIQDQNLRTLRDNYDAWIDLGWEEHCRRFDDIDEPEEEDFYYDEEHRLT